MEQSKYTITNFARCPFCGKKNEHSYEIFCDHYVCSSYIEDPDFNRNSIGTSWTFEKPDNEFVVMQEENPNEEKEILLEGQEEVPCTDEEFDKFMEEQGKRLKIINNSKNSATILGFEIKEKYTPAVYRWAKDNPETLESSVRNMIRQDGWEFNSSSVGSMLALLESDLG